jgi:DNA-directed RNA polymerase specialized sigma24 family protein
MRPEAEGPRTPDWLPPAGRAEDFFHAHAPGVYSLVYRLLGCPEAAGEVTLAVLLGAVENPAMPTGDSVTAWLRAAAVRAALGHRAGHPSGYPRAASGDLAPLEEALAGLPAPYRDTFVLVDIEGVPSATAATMLGVDPVTLRRRLHAARLRLREAVFAPPGSGRERRKAPRDPAHLAAFVHLAGTGEATQAVVADRSAGGLALWIGRPLPVGSRLLVWADPAHGSGRWQRAEVRHCRPRDHGGWAVGCRVEA